MAISKIPMQGFSQQGINFRNIIINGDMSIAQRGTSTTGVTTTDGYYACDRWRTQTDTGTWTISQSTDVPSGQGFAYSMKLDCTSAGTSNGDEVALKQRIEGQNLQYLKYGTSNAQSLTCTFWIKTNKTGTYSAVFNNLNSSQERVISFDYTVSSANTWEKKTITLPGDTVRSIDNTNTEEFNINLYFGAAFGTGVTNTWQNYSANYLSSGNLAGLGGSTDDEVYITGVQIEAGTTASDFEFLPVDVNLDRCKRYFQTKGTSLSPNAFTNNQTVAMGLARTVSSAQCYMELNPIMRSEPTVSGIGTLSNLKCHTATGGNVDTSSKGADGTPNRQHVTYIANNLTSGLNNNEPVRLYGDYTITFDAEL